MQLLLAGLAAAVFAVWLLLHLNLPAWPALVVAALAARVTWHLTPPRPARLAWDGAVWSLDGQPGQVDLMLDLQHWLLLRFRPAVAGAVRWLPVPDAEAAAARQTLRAALYSRAVLPPPAPEARHP
ncbi:MAG: hypothetical protein WAQ05_22355 [Rubrivivax sp.]